MSMNFFNVDVTAPVAEQNPLSATEFRPSAKKGTGGVYDAYIRFLPNPQNPASGSIAFKYAAYVTNYADNTSRWVDCPSSQGLPDPIQETFFKLRKSSNPNQQKAAESFSRKARYASLIQVIDCKSDPSLNGKILVWPYGKKVYEKIYAEMNPGNAMMTAQNPFNMITGRPFFVRVKEVMGFNNFDESQFFDSKVPINVQVPFNGGLVAVTSQSIQEPAFAEAVNNWLTNEAPSLEPYMYKEWDDETRNFVTNAITAANNPNVIVGGQGTMATGQAPVAGGFAGTQQPAAMPGMPGLGTPAATMPGMPGMPGIQPTPAPATPVAAPQPGQPAAVAPQPAVQATTPGGFAASNVPNVDEIINAGNPAPAASEAPQTGGININDVLGSIM